MNDAQRLGRVVFDMVIDICNAPNEDELVKVIENVINAVTFISGHSVEDSKVILMSVIATLALDLKRCGACVPTGVTLVVKESSIDVDKN